MSKSKSRFLADLIGASGHVRSDKMDTAAKSDMSNVGTLPASVKAQLKGDIGVTGAKGNTGSQGIQGVTGNTGPAGSNGTIGVDGAAGVAGAQGVKGNTGSTGAVGAQGIQGLTGSTGLTGGTGPTGSQGLKGNTGAAGTNGSNGATGPQGGTGLTGATGLTGSTGSAGSNGTNGAAGIQGIKGNTGSPGAAGSNGTNGTDGADGADSTVAGPQGGTGATGAVGAQGGTGLTGAAGATGAQGVKGDTGNTGGVGSQGVAGTPGSAGAKGDKGDTGNTGGVGSTGAASTVAGPQGSTGSTGSTGAAGADGSPDTAAQVLAKIKTVDVNGSAGVNAGRLDGHALTTAATANTVAERDGSADITARLFRSTYSEQSSAPATSADIAFRNSTSDNYTRFMTSAAFKSYCDSVGVSVDGHTHNYAAASHTHSYQAADADLLSIGGLTGTSGYLKKTAADTWTLDTSTFALSSHSHNYLGSTAKAADSDKLDGLDLHTGRNNLANRVMRTDSDGYANFGWINTNSGATTSAPARIYGSQDSYLRYYTPATLAPFILNQGSTKNAHTHNYAATSHTHSYLPLSGGAMTGNISFSSGQNITRTTHSSGFLEGSYNNVGGNSGKSNPIYTIGSSYNPSDTALSNMYGIGFASSAFTSILDGWGLYVASDGDARIGLSGATGRIKTVGTIYADGLINSAASVRAPIFYDNNNTAYFTDPHNNSNMNTMTMGGDLTFGQHGKGVVGLYSSSKLQNVFTMGAAYKLTANGTSASNHYGIAWSHQNAGSIGGANNLASHGMLILENGVYKGAWGGGSLRTPTDVRAPIFYDLNNTGYYTNPASNSHLNTLTTAGTITATGNVRCNGSFLMDGHAVFNGSDTWMRTSGATGWYSATYGGGMYMTDSTWVRTYGSKSLYVSNQIAASGQITAYYSDERLKTSTGNIENAIDKVKSLNGFTYVENELARSLGYSNTRQQVGISAQEIQAILPEAVSLAPVDMHTDEFSGEITSLSGEDYLTVDYSRIVPLLIEAIKEQQVQIDELKEMVKWQ